MKNRTLALLNCHNSPELGALTDSRPLASTSFLGRYALMDFALSNFTNSGISNAGVLVKDHQRSIQKHMGNMMSWANNTKTGRIALFFNEQGILNPAYNTDLNNIKQNDYVLYESNADLLVFEAPHIIASIDLSKYIEEHSERNEEITIVYKEIDDADKEFVGAHTLEVDDNGYLQTGSINQGDKSKAKVSMEIWLINRETMFKMIKEHQRCDAAWGISEMIVHMAKHGLAKVHCVPYTGYARRFDSLEHYVQYSFELLDLNVSKQLFLKDWPIFTRTHDTPPAIYGPDSVIKNSFISNGCLIDGEVKDSIICRGVKLAKGTVVEHSIVLSNVEVQEGAKLKHVVIDKYSKVTKKHTIQGDKDNLIYLIQGITA